MDRIGKFRIEQCSLFPDVGELLTAVKRADRDRPSSRVSAVKLPID